MKRFCGLVAFAVLVLPGLAGAEQDTVVEGAWVGAANGLFGPAMFSFHDQNLVYVDNDMVMFGTWRFAGKGRKAGDKAWIFDVDFVQSAGVHRDGRPMKRNLKGHVALGIVRIEGDRMRLCANPPRPPPGLARPKLQLPAGRTMVRCFDLKRVPTRAGGLPGKPSRCVAECIRQNQMRAVGPEVIRADCERSCRKRR